MKGVAIATLIILFRTLQRMVRVAHKNKINILCSKPYSIFIFSIMLGHILSVRTIFLECA
jgi:hypothetical protein